jgi:hypothetical protein
MTAHDRTLRAFARHRLSALSLNPVGSANGVVVPREPVPMILHCPRCHVQHVDEPDERTPDWTNPPHRSHLCHACGCIWRPADIATEGVRSIATVGKADTALNPQAAVQREDEEACVHCGTEGWGSDHAEDCPNNPVPGHGTGTMADVIRTCEDQAAAFTRLAKSVLAAIDTGRNEPLQIIRDQLRSFVEDQEEPADAIIALQHRGADPIQAEIDELVTAYRDAKTRFRDLTVGRLFGLLGGVES